MGFWQIEMLGMHDIFLAIVDHGFAWSVVHIVLREVFHHGRIAALVHRNVHAKRVDKAQRVVRRILDSLIAPYSAYSQ